MEGVLGWIALGVFALVVVIGITGFGLILHAILTEG